MAEYIENPLSGKLRGVTYEDGKIIDVHIRDTDDVVKVFVPMASEKEATGMAEYIDREVFKKSVEEYYCKPCKAEGKDYNGCRCRACWVDDMLDEIDCFQPAADVEPVKRGRWIMGTGENGLQTGHRKCSRCGEIVKYGYSLYGVHNFCNYCGAKMNEEA